MLYHQITPERINEGKANEIASVSILITFSPRPLTPRKKYPHIFKCAAILITQNDGN